MGLNLPSEGAQVIQGAGMLQSSENADGSVVGSNVCCSLCPSAGTWDAQSSCMNGRSWCSCSMLDAFAHCYPPHLQVLALQALAKRHRLQHGSLLCGSRCYQIGKGNLFVIYTSPDGRRSPAQEKK